MEAYYIGNYCKVCQNDNSNDVLIVFSAVGVPPRKFNGTTALKEISCNIIYLNCNKSWYIKGIEGLGESLEKTIEKLKELIFRLTLGVGKIITYGGSMGGYGAILYGCLLNAEMVIATGAELKLLIKGGATEKILRKRVDYGLISQINLSDIVKKSTTSVYLYYGENYYSDLLCGLEILGCDNVTIKTLKNFNHSLPPYIDSYYSLKDFITFHVIHRQSFDFGNQVCGDLLNYPDLVVQLYNIVYQFNSLNEQMKLESLNILKSFFENEKFSQNIRSHASFALSVWYQKNNQLDTSIQYSKVSVKLNSTNLRFWLKLSSLMLKAEKYSAAIFAGERALELERPDLNLDGFSAFVVKMRGLLKLGYKNEAICFYNSFKSRFESQKKSDVKRQNRIALFGKNNQLFLETQVKI